MKKFKHWGQEMANIEFVLAIQCRARSDIKYLLEGIFVLYKLSRKHAKLRRQIYAKINRLHSSTLLSINKQNKLNTLSKSKASELNDDMVWSFSFVKMEFTSKTDLKLT